MSRSESKAREGMEDVEEGEKWLREEGEGRVCGCNDVESGQWIVKVVWGMGYCLLSRAFC